MRSAIGSIALQPSNPRHAAITRSLYSWTNYKNWTDKVRSNWDKDKERQVVGSSPGLRSARVLSPVVSRRP